jgi:hypothetical protein
MKLLPFVRTLSIQTKEARLTKFSPNWAQVQYLEEIERQFTEGRPARVIVLKARQLGISTATEAVMFSLCFLLQRVRALVIAHEQEASEHLLSMCSTYWDTFPFKDLYSTRYQGRKHLAWNETASQIKVATAGNLSAGRSTTLHALHASEVAFWADADTLMAGLRQTVPSLPGTFIALESTANGVGNWFYRMWHAAVNGENEYTPMFFPWWEHPEYAASRLHLPVEHLGELDAEERLLRRMGLDDDRLMWRRWAIANLCQADEKIFHQEYPSTPEEAFVATGANVFPSEHLRECFAKMRGQQGRLIREPNGDVRFAPDISGPLTIYRFPSRDTDWGRYFVGGDPTHTTRGDYAVAQVINRHNYEQVARWRGRIDPQSFAEELVKLGTFYNRAMISTEITGPGYATIGAILEQGYPSVWQHRWADKTPGHLSESYGFTTTHRHKQWAIGHLLKLIVDHEVTVHDQVTFNEMLNYVTLDNGGFGPASDKMHDDTVMALAITCVCASTEGLGLPYGSAQHVSDDPTWESWFDQERIA